MTTPRRPRRTGPALASAVAALGLLLTIGCQPGRTDESPDGSLAGPGPGATDPAAADPAAADPASGTTPDRPTAAGAPRPGDDDSPVRPNVVLVLTDDLGYGDLGCYGETRWRTPHLDRMAAEGLRCTDFYVSQAVCSASRASILTGCYANRVGFHGAIGPNTRWGIADEEQLLPELLREVGYATACFGKWHLGCHPETLPLRHGFDEYYGIPYSNDMWPRHPENPEAWTDLPTIDGERTLGVNTDQSRFTTDFTRRAVAFVERSVAAGRPFFLYLAHPMPHVPLAVSAERAGASGAGLYGDVIQELDWSVGQVLGTLERLGVDDETLVVFTSDNGPWLSYGDHAGTTGGLREGKGTSWEGGVRVPCLVRWPGVVPAGRAVSAPWMSIDLLPTIVAACGAPRPERVIDGVDARPLWTDPDSDQARDGTHAELVFWYHENDLEALRAGRWKLQLPHAYRTVVKEGGGGRPGRYDYRVRTGLALYDLERDPGETEDVAERHPQLVAHLLERVERWRARLGDDLTGAPGPERRPHSERAPDRPVDPDQVPPVVRDGGAAKD